MASTTPNTTITSSASSSSSSSSAPSSASPDSIEAAQAQLSNGLFVALKPAVEAIDANVKSVFDSQHHLSERVDSLSKGKRPHLLQSTLTTLLLSISPTFTPIYSAYFIFNITVLEQVGDLSEMPVLTEYTDKLSVSRNKLNSLSSDLVRINARLENIRGIVRSNDMKAQQTIKSRTSISTSQQKPTQPQQQQSTEPPTDSSIQSSSEEKTPETGGNTAEEVATNTSNTEGDKSSQPQSSAPSSSSTTTTSTAPTPTPASLLSQQAHDTIAATSKQLNDVLSWNQS